MKSFGYTISKDRQIDYDGNDRQVARFINEAEPSIRLCMGCGSCTATCTAGHFTDFNIRRVHTFVRRGELHHLKKEIMKCMLCGKCQLVCPRGVNLRNLVLAIHSVLVKSEDGGQRIEDGGSRIEDRGSRIEDRGWKRLANSEQQNKFYDL